MSNENKMKNIPVRERPYEKCLAYGPASLDDAELLAVILRSGSSTKNSVELSREILRIGHEESGLLGLMHRSVAELTELPGIGTVKAIQLLCIGELSTRIATQRARIGLSVTDPSSIADYYMERLRHEEQEVLILMMLDSKNHLIADQEVFRGTVNSAYISPRELFLTALSHRAVYILLLHNHPSGNPEPSREDIDATLRIRSAGELLGITLLDHIVIGDRCYTSMLEAGMISNV